MAHQPVIKINTVLCVSLLMADGLWQTESDRHAVTFHIHRFLSQTSRAMAVCTSAGLSPAIRAQILQHQLWLAELITVTRLQRSMFTPNPVLWPDVTFPFRACYSVSPMSGSIDPVTVRTETKATSLCWLLSRKVLKSQSHGILAVWIELL